MGSPLPLPLEHLRLRLRALNLSLRRAIEARRATTARQISTGEAPVPEPYELTAEQALFAQVVQSLNPQARLCISDQQVDFLLNEVASLCRSDDPIPSPEKSWLDIEQNRETTLREKAGREGSSLPLDQLTNEVPLSPTQVEAVVLCAAPEFDTAYETLFAFILNDVSRRQPCPELFCLLAESLRDRFDRRLEFGRFGRLRLRGLLVPQGTAPSEYRQEFRLAPGVFGFLLEGRGNPEDLFGDRDEVRLPERAETPAHVEPAEVERLARGLRDETAGVVGVWGPRQADPEDVALAIVRRAGLPLRRCTVPDARALDAGTEQAIRESIQAASVLDAILWVRTDALTGAVTPEAERLGELLADRLAASRVRVILTGPRPWLPTHLLAARSCQWVELKPPDVPHRDALWERSVPGAPPPRRHELAARFPLSPTEVRAAANVAATAAVLDSVAPVPPGSRAAPAAEPLETACAAIDRQNTPRFATLTVPRRGPDDLILPEPLKSQVLEIADFHRAWPDVAGKWDFGRMMTGSGGIKALFTGDPGTGKTLAAEVIARKLERPLLKLDLSQVVSKWVGETEKHLDAAFREAEDRDSVLCLDEADSLLGKRGEIRHGTDRYANLEVSYLLQRLEDHPGLVVMASNHKENIDPAFTRRFQAIFHFPRPGYDERAKIWELAFPRNTAYDLSPRVRVQDLARLDMTGAAIVDSARTAALLAAKSALPGARATIELAHVAEAVKRQFQSESRLLSAKELAALGEAP